VRRSDEASLVPGAVMVVGVHADVVTSARPRVVAWQVVELDARLAFIEHGPTFRRRSEAQAFGLTVFPLVTRWRRIAIDRDLGTQGPPPTAEPSSGSDEVQEPLLVGE